MKKLNIKPLLDRVLVEAMTDAKEKTKSGILLPESMSKERPEQGKVIAVGEGKFAEDGTRIPLSVSVGDTVLFTKYGPDEIKVDGKEYLIIKEESILAIIK